MRICWIWKVLCKVLFNNNEGDKDISFWIFLLCLFFYFLYSLFLYYFYTIHSKKEKSAFKILISESGLILLINIRHLLLLLILGITRSYLHTIFECFHRSCGANEVYLLSYPELMICVHVFTVPAELMKCVYSYLPFLQD